MTLPAFASVDDLEDVGFDASETAEAVRAQAALDRSSTLIRVEAGTSWVTDGVIDFGTLADYQQDAIVQVCIAAAKRSLDNPEAVQSETVSLDDGSHARTYTNASPDVYLTRAEKNLLHQIAGKSGLWVQPTSRGDRLETPPMYDRIEDTVDPVDVLAAAQSGVRRR